MTPTLHRCCNLMPIIKNVEVERKVEPRGVAPPERARGVPRTPPGEVVDSEDEDEWGVANGQDAPMTPDEGNPSESYAPTSPASDPGPMNMATCTR